MQAISGKDRFRKIRSDFPFGKRILSLTPASSAGRFSPENVAVVPWAYDASDRTMLHVVHAPVGDGRGFRFQPVEEHGSRLAGF